MATLEVNWSLERIKVPAFDDRWRDLPAYLDTQQKAGAAFGDPAAWSRMAILNVARMGKFSSDRAVREYARDIWDLKSL